MQKAFDLIVERLEEAKPYYNRILDSLEAKKFEVGQIAGLNDAIEIVNQVAQTYEQEVCEWKQCGGNLRPYQTTSCEKFALHDISYVYCPYCGKRIKVIE